MAIEPFIYARAITELLNNTLNLRKYIDRYIVDNIRILVQYTKLALENTNQYNPKLFNISFITEHDNNADNYSKIK